MRILIMAAAAALATACASQAPVYESRSEGGRYGYAEMLVQPNRLRISYNGDTLTPRETVETYLLYRAAEATLERGFEYFAIAAHDAQENSRYETFGARPRLGGITVREISNHTAMAEIIMFEGDAPPPIANVYDARAVIGSLENRIVRPATR
jgi:hypothetical protein